MQAAMLLSFDAKIAAATAPIDLPHKPIELTKPEA
eukprot:CAMPEP_0172830662 /NCGR_PEP_ID=MMETSP1075-20121228/22422_1 /TAXON_ID=2916 /ORGANISM="Ceratium fusus, Strain PA161109" /LENGTH=34 /DNA_ID= /DNA_START= /DNA_END= /DNA_ORIENTATION=